MSTVSGTISARPVDTGAPKFDEGTFDLARWRPVTPEEYMREMMLIALDNADDVIEGVFEALPDGRTRVTHEANVKPAFPGGPSGFLPYLTVIYDPESVGDRGRASAFRRTDVRPEFDSGISRGRN